MCICDHCNGSGEGIHESELCGECKGSVVGNKTDELSADMEQALSEDYQEFMEDR